MVFSFVLGLLKKNKDDCSGPFSLGSRNHLWTNRYLLGMIVLGATMPSASSQTIQLPTMGNFSVQTSVAAPDSGGAQLGRNHSSAQGSQGRSAGPFANRSSGSGVRLPMGSVHVTVIDLAELDQAILNASEKGRLGHQETPPPTWRPESGRSADYAYMALLNHPNDISITQDYAGDIRFYVQRAKSAKEGRHWASAQLFYEQAWKRLTPEQQKRAIESMAKQALASDKPKGDVR